MPRWIINTVLCLLPLAVSPGLLFLIADGYLNFGGGEKDIILMIPWLIWSVVYAILFGVFWAKRWPRKRVLAYASGGATGLLIVAWLVLFVYATAWLGMS
jgi:hypothetical protein